MLRVCCRSIITIKGFWPSVIFVYTKLSKIPSFKADGGLEVGCSSGIETGHAASCAFPHIRATLEANCDAKCPAAHVTGTHEDGPVRILKVPLLQGEQFVPSFPVNPGLQVQFVKALLASDEFDAAGQFMHTSKPAATTTEYFPDMHARHTSELAPAITRYFPDTQLIHTSEAAASVLEYLPATQFMHTSEAAPNIVEYLPFAQLTHVSESAATTVENLPAIQLSQTSEVAPAEIKYFPAMQLTQRSEAAPTTNENLPATHSVHDAGPGIFLNVPAAHSTHTEGVAAF